MKSNTYECQAINLAACRLQNARKAGAAWASGGGAALQKEQGTAAAPVVMLVVAMCPHLGARQLPVPVQHLGLAPQQQRVATPEIQEEQRAGGVEQQVACKAGMHERAEWGMPCTEMPCCTTQLQPRAGTDNKQNENSGMGFQLPAQGP